jgi:hypothetical protein
LLAALLRRAAVEDGLSETRVSAIAPLATVAANSHICACAAAVAAAAAAAAAEVGARAAGKSLGARGSVGR